MRTVLLVARREITTLLRRPSFYFGAALVPLIIAAITFGFSFIGDEFGDDGGGGSGETPSNTVRSGYIDEADVVVNAPAPFATLLRAFADEDAAAAALRDGTITSYFVIGARYRDDGQVTRVSPQSTFTSSSAPDSRLMSDLLRLNLAGDAALAERLAAPLTLQMEVVDAATTDDGTDRTGFSYALAMLLLFSIVNGGGWLIQAVAEEKENRTIELVLTSVSPVSLMAGKLIGLGVISLLQLIAWLVLGGLIVGGQGSTILGMVGEVPAMTLLWALVYFLLGFLMLGALMMSLGAIGASVRESGQLSSAITLPVVAPIWLGSAIIASPDGLLARIMSFIPITAPVTMMLRLGMGAVAAWQIALSIALLVLAVVIALWIAARLFRASTLLTGAKPTPRVIWQALRG